MTPKVKITLSILIAITLTGVGYFFIKPKQDILPPINTSPKTEEINTSDWQTYRNETLGFEIKMPKEWSGGYYLGRFDPDDIEFWQDQVGGARFNGLFRVSSSPQFRVRVKDSDLSLEEFARRVGFGREENTLVNNLQVVRYFLDGRKDKQPNYREALLIQNNSRYHYFEFSASDDNIDNDIVIWNKIIFTFKPLD